jgi:hypothetical protein
MLPIDFQSIDALIKKPNNVIDEFERRSSATSDDAVKADHLCVLVHGYVSGPRHLPASRTAISMTSAHVSSFGICLATT